MAANGHRGENNRLGYDKLLAATPTKHRQAEAVAGAEGMPLSGAQHIHFLSPRHYQPNQNAHSASAAASGSKKIFSTPYYQHAGIGLLLQGHFQVSNVEVCRAVRGVPCGERSALR